MFKIPLYVIVILLLLKSVFVSESFCKVNDISSCEFNLPEGTGKIVYEQKLIHPMMPEFDRRLIINSPKYNGKMFDLPMDTCGIDEINLYIYRSGDGHIKYLRLQDALDEYAVDMDKGAFYIITRAGGKTFISEYYKGGDFPSTIEFGPVTVTDEEGNVIDWPCELPIDGVEVTANGKQSPEFKGYFATEPGVYIGRIHGGRRPEFIPASKEKEMKIEYLYENHRKAPWQ